MNIVQARKLGIEVRVHPDTPRISGVIMWQVKTPDGEWHEFIGRSGQSVLDVWSDVLNILSEFEIYPATAQSSAGNEEE